MRKEQPRGKRKEWEGRGAENKGSAREGENSERCTAIDFREGLKCFSCWADDVSDVVKRGKGRTADGVLKERGEKDTDEKKKKKDRHRVA